MKTLLIVFTLFFSIKSNGQTPVIDINKFGKPLTNKWLDSAYKAGWRMPTLSSLMISAAPKPDTIPTILLCGDTSEIKNLFIYEDTLINWKAPLRFEGLSTPIAGTQTTTFTLVGYRVQGNILYTITSKKQLIDGITYLDDKKRPLPASFIVFSFVDRKK